jgi:hypothetical protein
MDDAKVESDGVSSTTSQAIPEDEVDVNGFVFKRLIERHPELEAELLTFRDSLLSLAEGQDSGVLKVNTV